MRVQLSKACSPTEFVLLSGLRRPILAMDRLRKPLKCHNTNPFDSTVGRCCMSSRPSPIDRRTYRPASGWRVATPYQIASRTSSVCHSLCSPQQQQQQQLYSICTASSSLFVRYTYIGLGLGLYVWTDLVLPNRLIM